MNLEILVVGFESGQFTDDSTNEVIEWARVHSLEQIDAKKGYGNKPVAYKANPQVARVLRQMKLPAKVTVAADLTPAKDGQFRVRVESVTEAGQK